MIPTTELLENASLFGVAATERFLLTEDADWRFTALFAATSLEQLIKAALADRNVLLLADNDKAMMALVGVKSDRLRTIGAAKAVERYGQLNIRFRPLTKNLHQLLEVRNGVVHLALEPPETFPKSMETYLRAVEVVLEDLNEDEEDFWGSHNLHAVVADRRLQRVRSLQEEVDSKIAAAAVRFDSKYRGLPEQERLAAITAAEKSAAVVLSDVEFQIECPACKSQGWLAGDLDVEWEIYEIGWMGHLHLLPFYFKCLVCDLDLDGQEEIEFGVGDIELPSHYTAEDFSEPPSVDDIPGYSPEDVHPYPDGR